MKEFVISEVKAETAVLVGLVTKTQDEAKTKEYLDELEFLADTAGAVTVKRFTQKVVAPNQTTYVGKGKLEEIKQYIKDEEEEDREIGMVIFDDELSAKQIRNIEQELQVKILTAPPSSSTSSPCAHRRLPPRPRWNWRSIATCCLDCNDSGLTWSARVVALAPVAARVLWDCVDLVRPSSRWTAVSSSAE